MQATLNVQSRTGVFPGELESIFTTFAVIGIRGTAGDCLRQSHAILLVIIIPSLLFVGCGYDKHDPAVYPVQFDIVREFRPIIDSVRPFHVDSLNSTELLVTYFTPPERTTERYFQVENLSGSRVLERYNLEPPSEYYHPVPDYLMTDLIQHNQDENYTLFRTATDTSIRVFLYDMKLRNKFEIFDLSDPSNAVSNSPTFYATGQFTKSDQSDDTYVAIIYWLKVKEWRLRVVNYKSGSVQDLFDVSIGVPPAKIHQIDSNSDGIPEFIYETTAPGSGYGNDLFTDTHAYTICLSDQGDILWYIDQETGGGGVYLFYSDSTAICVRSKVAFAAEEKTVVSRIDLRNGDIFWKHRISDKTETISGDEKFPKLVIISQDTVFKATATDSGLEKQVLDSNHRFNNSEMTSITTGQDDQYYLARESIQLFVLNKEFNVIGFTDDASLQYYLLTPDNEPGFAVLARDREYNNVLLQPRKVSWTSWWITRYRRQLVFFLAIPLLLLAIWALVRYVRLKVRAAREYRMLSQQLAEVTREKYREQVENSRKWGKRVHDNIGRELSRLGRLLEETELQDGNPPKMQHVLTVRTSLDDLVETARNLSQEIRPPETLLTLPSMLRVVTDRYKELVDIELNVDPGTDAKESVLAVLLSALSEIFTNIIRHAEADRVKVSCRFEGDKLVLQVRDNGRGIRPEDIQKTTSLGLVSLREEIASFGGRFQIERVKTGGTQVDIELDGIWVEDKPTGELEWVPIGFETKQSGED